MAARLRKARRRRYVVDYDWLWQRHDPTARAVLRAVVSHVSPDVAHSTLDRFIASLPADSRGVRGRAGWAVFPVDTDCGAAAVDIVSGGEDVADGIQSGADAVFDALTQVDGVSITWHQLTSPDTCRPE